MILFCIKNLEPILKNFYLVVFLLHKYRTQLLWACNKWAILLNVQKAFTIAK